MRRNLATAALVLSMAACQPAGQAPAPAPVPAHRVDRLETDRQRASYMVGLDVARTLQPIKDEIDLALVEQGMRDALDGRAPLLDAAALERTRTQFSGHLRTQREAQLRDVAATNLREGDAFLAANAAKPGVQRTASGLQYLVLKPGAGARPSATDTVRVNYIGKRLDGQEFENTYALDHPAEMPLGQVMPGWREALTLMPVGSKYRVWIPAALAYGERGVPGTIEPNSTLVFEIELLAVAAAPGG